MAVHFHSLKVKEVKKETPDCVSISFTVPEELKNEFVFDHGQNITLKKSIDGEEIRRSYSICAAPFENELRVAVKKMEGGKFSVYANTVLAAGDELEVLPPTGKFNTRLKKENTGHYLAFAAGSGITPVISIIKTTLAQEPESAFTLVYGNKNRNSIIFFEELEGLKNKYLQRFSLINILSREKTSVPLNFGRINADKLRELAGLVNYQNIDEFFICGPETMVFCIRDFLSGQGISNKHIHFELFSTGGQKKTIAVQKTGAANEGPVSRITVKLDGRSFGFELPFSSDTSLLDAALQQGADLPFACRGGMCCTCKARLLEGAVSMDVHWGLEEEEIEQGFILTCQSHPLTENIVVDFDIK